MKWLVVAISIVASLTFFGVVIVLGLGLTGERAHERCMSVIPGKHVNAEVEWLPPKLTCRSGNRVVGIDQTPKLVVLAIPSLLPLVAVFGAVLRARRAE